MKVVLVGDSLSLPRQGLLYEETWPCLLRENFKDFHFIPVLRRSLTSKVLVTEGGGDGSPGGADTLEFYSPSIVIIHLGIVDCAPRLFTKLESSVVNLFPALIRKLIISTFKFSRGRSDARALVPPNEFEANMEAYAKRCESAGVKKLLLVEIVKPGEQMVKSNPGITAAVIKYNTILRKVQTKFNFIETVVFDYREASYFEDGYHLSKIGNQQLYESIKNCLPNICH